MGNAVIGGCILMNGCLQVQQEGGSAGMNAICIACDPFEFVLHNGECVCAKGTMAGEHCTSVVGCISTEKVGGVVICTYCNQMLGFQLNPALHTCECQSGYAFQNNQCQDICGDGRVLDSECDDGNLQDGDGCSSQCQI